MADEENTNMEVDEEKNKPFANKVEPLVDEVTQRIGNQNNVEGKKNAGESRATAEYCEQLQAWMWQYYTGYVNWQSWLAASAMSCPYYLQSASGTSTAPLDINSQSWYNSPFGLPLSPYPPALTSPSNRAGAAAGGAAVSARPQQLPQENGNAQRPGKSCRLCIDNVVSTLSKCYRLPPSIARKRKKTLFKVYESPRGVWRSVPWFTVLP